MSLIAPKAFVDLGTIEPDSNGKVSAESKVKPSHEYLRFFEDVVRSFTSRILTTDLVIDDASLGLVMKDTQDPAHYWRLTVNTSGVLVTTDLGTTRP